MLRTTLLATSFLIAAAVAAPAQSDYPDRPITIIVPYGAGGPTDTVSRLIAESMAKVLGQTLVVENAGGAGSTVGAARVARSDADGYTLMINHVAQASSGSLYRKLAFDPDADFDGIGRITDVPMTVVAKADLEPTDIAGPVPLYPTVVILTSSASISSMPQRCDAEPTPACP